MHFDPLTTRLWCLLLRARACGSPKTREAGELSFPSAMVFLCMQCPLGKRNFLAKQQEQINHFGSTGLIGLEDTGRDLHPKHTGRGMLRRGSGEDPDCMKRHLLVNAIADTLCPSADLGFNWPPSQ